MCYNSIYYILILQCAEISELYGFSVAAVCVAVVPDKEERKKKYWVVHVIVNREHEEKFLNYVCKSIGKQETNIYRTCSHFIICVTFFVGMRFRFRLDVGLSKPKSVHGSWTAELRTVYLSEFPAAVL